MRCARCNRPLRTATMQISGCNYGPKCLERMGLATTKQKRTRKVKQARAEVIHADQFELELEWMP